MRPRTDIRTVRRGDHENRFERVQCLEYLILRIDIGNGLQLFQEHAGRNRQKFLEEKIEYGKCIRPEGSTYPHNGVHIPDGRNIDAVQHVGNSQS